MPRRYRVALHGFSDFERSSLTFCFRQAAKRVPGYVQVDSIDNSDFIVADARRGAARGARLDDTLFIGATAPPGAKAHLQRPIDPERILRALDDLAT